MLRLVRNSKGFTLVELAIVLVIIGIILGAVLKGQELINNAKAKRIQSDLRGIEASIYTYMDRKGRLPGNCNGDGTWAYVAPLATTQAAAPLSNNTDPTADYCALATTGETMNTSWSDLRASQVLNTSTPNIILGKHSMNDYYKMGTGAVGGVNYNIIVVYGIPAWLAKSLDVYIDGIEDGTAGRFRNHSTAATGSAWPADNLNNQLVSGAYFFDKAP